MTIARPRLALFISPHGFGHAARAVAILAALKRRHPGLRATIYTAVPQWFFTESLTTSSPTAAADIAELSSWLTYQQLVCDVGLIQPDPLHEDLPATITALERLFAAAEDWVPSLAAKLAADGVDLLWCDIAPLGIAVARQAGIPSLLCQNFTWELIYQNLVASAPRFTQWIERLGALTRSADYCLSLSPSCADLPGARRVPPVARQPRADRSATRRALGIVDGDKRPLVVVSMGGIPTSFAPPGSAASFAGASSEERALAESLSVGWLAARELDALVAFLGASRGELIERTGDLLLLPHHSPLYHPDLLAAADLVVTKLGYSTVAEAWHAGARLLYLTRPTFAESAVLARFVAAELTAAELPTPEIATGRWVERARSLLRRPAGAPRPAQGADEAAAVISEALGRGRARAQPVETARAEECGPLPGVRSRPADQQWDNSGGKPSC